MEGYLIDNNIISNYFSENFSIEMMSFLAEVIDNTPNISVITQIEALSWISPAKEKENVIKSFINESEVYGITDDIGTISVKIRRSKKTKTPDAIIAATAIVNDFTIITCDNDFNNIKDLKIFNPNEL